MKLYDLIQLLIVASAILISALYAVGRAAPNLRARCATWLLQSTHSRWLQAIGAKMASGGGGCGSGCNTCGTCESSDKDGESALKALDKIPVNHV